MIKHKFFLISLILIMVVLAACGGGQDTASDGESEGVAAEDLKLAAIFPGTITDADYNTLGHIGITSVKDDLGVEIAFSETVAVPDVDRVMREYIDDGSNIIFTHGGQFLNQTMELAKEFPNFGYVKEESHPVVPRIRALLASPLIRSVFSARGAFGWLYESRLGTEGLVTERIAYADILATIWKLMKSGSDPAMLKDMYSKLMLMLNLQHTHPGNLRGYSLYLLKMRGVFRTMISRQYGPGGGTPAKPIFSDLALSEEEIAEIEWRFESLKPYLKPGKFDG